MRRAEFEGSAGRLSVGEGWLLFVADAQHDSAPKLEQAARGEQPGRALATIVVQSGFDLSPFVFAQEDKRIRGIVYGALKLHVHDGEVATIDGETADPWAHLNAPPTATLLCGDSDRGCQSLGCGFWVSLGVVSADSFRWFRDSEESTTERPSSASDDAVREGLGDPSPEAMAVPAVGPSIESRLSVDARVSMMDALSSDFDATIDAIRFAEIRGDGADSEPNPPKQRQVLAGPGPNESAAAPGSETEANGGDAAADADVASADADATIDVGSGQVLLDDLHAERRLVEALVCIECDNPNPPFSLRCRHCDTSLSSAATELRSVPQPVLGVVHLSGDREVLLDADLIIGRNPGYLPLDHNQRAVVHAERDRSVSRRHIELRLEQWKVMAVNHQEGGRTFLERRGGRRTPLAVDVPQQLKSGDTVRFGDAWLRFEADW